MGELVHNFNGNDCRVMENYGGGDVLLMQMNTGMFVVVEGIEAYKRYPKDDMPTAENMRTGIEWESGVYLGNDIAAINFKKLREEYGVPPEPNERGEYEIEINETLSHTETVKADLHMESVLSEQEKADLKAGKYTYLNPKKEPVPADYIKQEKIECFQGIISLEY